MESNDFGYLHDLISLFPKCENAINLIAVAGVRHVVRPFGLEDIDFSAIRSDGTEDSIEWFVLITVPNRSLRSPACLGREKLSSLPNQQSSVPSFCKRRRFSSNITIRGRWYGAE
jgi:hypothetical protein